MYYVGFAEDQSSQMSLIYESLANGRKLQYTRKEVAKKNIHFIYYDTLRDPENAANAFRVFFQKYENGIMMGTPSAECAQISKYVADSWDRTFICNSYQPSIVENVKTTLLMNQNPFYQGKLSARYLISEMKKQRICIIYDNANERLRSLQAGFSQEGNNIGATIMEISFSSKEGIDPNKLFAKVAQSDPDSIFLLTPPPQYESMLSTARNDFHIYTDIVFSTLPDQDFEWNPSWENTLFLIPFFEQKLSYVSSSFYKKYRDTFGRTPDYYAALGADEVSLLEYIVEFSKQNSFNHVYLELMDSDLTQIPFLTGLKGFDSKGLALKPIDIVTFQNQVLTFQQTYWHAFTREDM